MRFRNCLMSMQPNATNEDIPTSNDIEKFIHNKFIVIMKNLKSKVQVRI